MATEHEGSLGSRVKRYAQVSTSLSGTAARMVAERFFGLTPDHGAQARILTAALGNLKGPIMKIAQMLATIPDAIPSEYTLEFLNLQADAPSMGWPFVRRRMASELGPQWQQAFKSFENEACAAASLGQVHKATSHEGEALACKLQYADMASIVQADLQQLKLLLQVYEATLGALKTDMIFKEIQARLREELDYTLEAQHIKLYRQIFGKDPLEAHNKREGFACDPKPMADVHIPKVYDTLSTKHLLTMEWMEGRRLREILDEPQEMRNRIAREMFYAWYYPFYHFGVIHGDPHLGNYTFRDDGSINILDFGCVRKFSPAFVKGVLDLYHALLHNDQDLAVHAYETWGFTNISNELIDVLNLWAKLLYGPLLEDRVRPIQEGNTGTYGREIADKVHQELRRLGGVTPPPEFVFMDRAAVGIGSVCMHLQAEINWHQLFEEIVGF